MRTTVLKRLAAMGALAAVVALGYGPAQDEAHAACFTGCSSSSACNGTGHCSCSVSCSGPGACVCGDILCGQCANAPSGDAAFTLSPAAFAAAATQAYLPAAVLKNLSEHCKRQVMNGVTGGIANLGAGDFRYQVTTVTSPGSVTLRFAFARIGDGPLPEDAAYGVDSAGMVTQLD